MRRTGAVGIEETQTTARDVKGVTSRSEHRSDQSWHWPSSTVPLARERIPLTLPTRTNSGTQADADSVTKVMETSSVGAMNDPIRILVVEDDQRLGDLIAEFLRDHGFDVQLEHRGDESVARILADPPDLVLLDLGLPGKDGMAVCREVRETYDGGIIMLTAREKIDDQVAGLTVGADDYILKPPTPAVLLARIQSILRRRRSTSTSELVMSLSLGDLRLDRSRLRARVGARDANLTSTEFPVLWCLAEAIGEVVSRDQLYRKGLGVEWNGIDRRIDAYISKIRRKLIDAGLEPARLRSVRSEGYLLTPQ